MARYTYRWMKYQDSYAMRRRTARAETTPTQISRPRAAVDMQHVGVVELEGDGLGDGHAVLGLGVAEDDQQRVAGGEGDGVLAQCAVYAHGGVGADAVLDPRDARHQGGEDQQQVGGQQPGEASGGGQVAAGGAQGGGRRVGPPHGQHGQRPGRDHGGEQRGAMFEQAHGCPRGVGRGGGGGHGCGPGALRGRGAVRAAGRHDRSPGGGGRRGEKRVVVLCASCSLCPTSLRSGRRSMRNF